MADEEDYEKLAYKQRLKAAVHHTVGQICDDMAEAYSMSFNKQFIAALSESTFAFSQRMSTDLEMFARHAKRSTISVDDVKLSVRKSQDLLDYICGKIEEQQATTLEKKQKRTTTKKKKTKSVADQGDDEDSNMG